MKLHGTPSSKERESKRHGAARARAEMALGAAGAWLDTRFGSVLNGRALNLLAPEEPPVA